MAQFVLKISNPEKGSEKIFTIDLRPGIKFLFGRSDDTNFPIRDPKLSRKHFSLTWDGQKLLIQDENSSNGTFLNGMPLKLTQIFNKGDRVEIGIHTLEVVEVPNSLSTAPPNAPLPPLNLDSEKFSEEKTLVFEQPIPQTKHQLETMPHTFAAVTQLFKLAWKDPRNFHSSIEWSGSLKTSLLFILFFSFLSSLVSGFLQSGTSSLLFVLPAAMISTLWAVIFSGFLHFFRRPVELTQSFEHFLRFFAYASIFYFPASFLESSLLSFLNLFLMLYLWWVAYKVFSPNLFKLIMIILISIALGLGGIYFLLANSPRLGSGQRFLQFLDILQELWQKTRPLLAL